MKLKYLGSTQVTKDVLSFTFEPEQPISWKPGQYLHYILPHANPDDRGTERWFTNSAAPDENHVMISTRIAQAHGSSFKRALQELKPGEEVQADEPEGDFTLDDLSKNYIFVAGGIGITPFRSILVEADKQGTQPRVTLVYANRDTDIPFRVELDEIATRNPSLKIDYIVQPQVINKELLQHYMESVADPVFYVSGPAPMVKQFADDLSALGLPRDAIKVDDFPGYEAN